VRGSIVDIVFEMFVRSANHAYQKKIKSLIIFIVNVNELKEKNQALLIKWADVFFQIKNLVKINAPKRDKIANNSLSKNALKSSSKTKSVDIEFRDNTNSWIETTLNQIKKKKAYDGKTDKKNMEMLYLFRLLCIKYRCLYPLQGKPLTVDPDLTNRLENKVVKAFHKILQQKDEDN